MTLSQDTLQALHEAATKGDLSTADEHTTSEIVECPCCQGDGEVEAADYCNFDGVALGVQFYGIGNEFGAHEALWKYLRNAVPEILALIAERDAMRGALEKVGIHFERCSIWIAESSDTPADVRISRAKNAYKYAEEARAALGGNHHGS